MFEEMLTHKEKNASDASDQAVKMLIIKQNGSE